MSRRKTSRLLLDEEPLQVLLTLAEKVGINAAILLQQINYWIKSAEKQEVRTPAPALYAPECVEGLFHELLAEWVLRSPVARAFPVPDPAAFVGRPGSGMR